MSNLSVKVLGANEGKITNLEIQSHGLPAEIVTTPNDHIDYRTVAEFGTSLRPLMAQGALIEIMACQVASIVPRNATSTREPFRMLPGTNTGADMKRLLSPW